MIPCTQFAEKSNSRTDELRAWWENADIRERVAALRAVARGDLTYDNKKFNSLPSWLKIALYDYYYSRKDFREEKPCIPCMNFAEGEAAIFNLTEARKQTWRENLRISQEIMQKKGISCSDPNYHGSLADAEVADIGENYTWHTHPCGELVPSPADVKTTRTLKKDFLCLGVSTRGTACYDAKSIRILHEGMKERETVDRHSIKVVAAFR